MQEWAFLINDYVMWPRGDRAHPLRRLELVTRDHVDLRTLWCAPWPEASTPTYPSPAHLTVNAEAPALVTQLGQQTHSVMQAAGGTTADQSSSPRNRCQRVFTYTPAPS